MSKRQDLLAKAWIGPQLEFRGEPLILSPVRYSILNYWRNYFFDNSNTAQGEVDAVGEFILACVSSTDEMRELQRMPTEQRADKVREFMLEIEDQFDELMAGIRERLEAIRAAMVESELPGKEDAPAHVS